MGEVRAGWTRAGAGRRRRKRRARRRECRQCQHGVGPASQATPAIVRGWSRPAKAGGCPELDLILWQGVLEGELVEASRLGRLLIHIEACSIDRPTGSSSRGPGSRKVPPVERPSVSSNCIVTCSSPPARARPPARKFSSRRTPSSAVVETTCASRMMASSSTTTSPSPSSASSSSGLAAAAACSRVRPRRLVELCGPPCHAGSLWCHDTRSARHAPG